MKTRTRILFWLILLVVGLQWLGDPIEERLTGDPTPVAGWQHADANGPDNAHHFGVALLQEDLTPPEYAALLAPLLPLSGLALLGWLRPVSEARPLRPLATAPRSPRAPPTA